MYKQCRKDSKYKGELIKEKGESALYTPQTHTNPVIPPTAVTPLGITAVDMVWSSYDSGVTAIS